MRRSLISLKTRTKRLTIPWPNFLFAILLLFSHSTWSSPVVNGVTATPCPLQLESIIPEYGRILAEGRQQLDTLYPVDFTNQRDCWFFENPEHPGGVFVPWEWGVAERPESALLEPLVSRALTAIKTTLTVYAEADGEFDNPIFLGFLNDGHNGLPVDYRSVFGRFETSTMLTFTPRVLGEAACQIYIRHPDGWRVAQRANADPTEFVEIGIAHEIAHCYMGKKLYPLIPESARQSGFAKWWAEGAATYFAGLVFPQQKILTSEMRSYDFEKDILDNSYANYWLIGQFDYRGQFSHEYAPSGSLEDIERTSDPRFRNLWRFLELAAATDSKASAYNLINQFVLQKNRMFRALLMYRNGAFTAGRACSGADQPRLPWCTVTADNLPQPDRSLVISTPGEQSVTLRDVAPGRLYTVEVTLANPELSIVDFRPPFEEPRLFVDSAGLVGGEGPRALDASHRHHTPPVNPFNTSWYYYLDWDFGYCQPGYVGTKSRYVVYHAGSQNLSEVTLTFFVNSRERSVSAWREDYKQHFGRYPRNLPSPEHLCSRRPFYRYVPNP